MIFYIFNIVFVKSFRIRFTWLQRKTLPLRIPVDIIYMMILRLGMESGSYLFRLIHGRGVVFDRSV